MGTWEAHPPGYGVRFGRGFEVEAEPVRPATVGRLDGWFVAPGDGGCGFRGVRFGPDGRFQVLAGTAGTYHIDGWSLELRADSGRVTRGFFYVDLLRQVVWFEGEELSAAR